MTDYTDEDFKRDCKTLVTDAPYSNQWGAQEAVNFGFALERIIADRNRWKAMYEGAAHAANLQQEERHKAEAERDALKAEVERLRDIGPSPAAVALERCGERLAAAEKVCEAASQWRLSPALTKPTPAELYAKMMNALAEWEALR